MVHKHKSTFHEQLLVNFTYTSALSVSTATCPESAIPNPNAISGGTATSATCSVSAATGLPQTVQEDKIFVTDATGRSFSVLLAQCQTEEVGWVYRQINLGFNAENYFVAIYNCVRILLPQ